MKKAVARVVYAIGAAVALLWMVDFAMEYSLSLAVVEGGITPGFAAKDLAAFNAVSHPEETSPGISELKAEGRILSIDEGTRGRVIERYNLSCQGREYGASSVKLLDGPRNGQTVWMCSDEFVMLNKPL